MKIAFLFPGQGAQYPGMGRDFFEGYPEARQTFVVADEILGRKLSSLIFQGPEGELTETKNSQTGIYVTSVAILRVLQTLFPDIKPNFCAGLSLGEYTAATAAGYLNFESGLPLVQYRGAYMNEACEKYRGAMAVVLGLDASQVEKMVEEASLPHDLWAANFNCPGQVVISGTPKGIEAGSLLAKARGAKRVMPLNVHGAFHSGLMRPAQERLAEKVRDVEMHPAHAGLMMNVTGSLVKDPQAVRENLILQVTSPVRWEQEIRELEQIGIGLYVEIGPGETLAGFNKRIGVQGSTVSIQKVNDLKKLEEALQCRGC